MNGHEDLGSDAGLGPGRDVLKQTIGALVHGATPPDAPSAPEENLGLLRRRIRGWRIAKAGAVGLSTAMVVGALAFSAAQASTWTRSDPLPGRPTVHSTESGPVPSEIPTFRVPPSPSASVPPSPSASPSPSRVAVDPTPSAVASVEPTPEVSAPSVEPDPPVAVTAPFDDGYQPWGDSFPVSCGMPDEDLVSTSPSVAIEIVGDLSYGDEQRSIPVRLTGEMPGALPVGETGAGSEFLGDSALLVWSQAGRVVDLGMGWREGEYEVPLVLNETGEWTGEAYAAAFSTCVEADLATPDEGLYYDNVRAAGTYQVRAVQAHMVQDSGSGDREQYLLFSDPVTVTIP